MELILSILGLVLSVFIGGLLVVFLESAQRESTIKLMLAFSGGFLLSIGFIHFIPELYEHSEMNIGLFILGGFLIQLLLEFFSGGIEHGHVHAHKESKIPYAVIIALCIHAFIEGVPLGSQIIGEEMATSHHHGSDYTMLLGIVFHRIPVAIALMTLLIASEVSKDKAWVVMTVFALVSPLGLLLGMQGDMGIDLDYNAILAIVVGMFLHISTTIIFETSENHKFNFIKLVAIIGGGGLALFIH